MVEYLADLESTCSALGTSDGNVYIRDDDCTECIKDLIRFLRRDDDNHELRRRLGEIQVVQSDLLPLLRDHSGDAELFDLVLRVLVNLTNPELLLYREELPQDKQARHFYLQLQGHRQKYKAAFVDEAVWAVLTDKLQKLLAKDAAERLEDEQMVIERILILVRNVLQVPRDAASESALDTDVSVHDQILWVLKKSEMQDLLLYVASAEDEVQYCLHVLEIISLMFREQGRMAPRDDAKRRSTLSVRLFLKEFCIEFLTGAYNPLMLVVKDQLNRQRAQQNDESYYLWAVRFFMEFNRNYEFRADLVSETLNKPTFHYVQQQMEVYKDNFEHEKRNRAAYLLWSRRMHLALRAYQELLFTMVAMDKSADEEIRESSKRLKVKVFYEPEYRELCLMLFGIYAPEKFSKGFLKDLVETNHVFLKIMENMAKAKSLVIGKKVVKRKGGRGGKKGGGGGGGSQAVSAEVSQRETKEDLWERVSSRVSSLLQRDEDDDPLPAVTPFDATSEVPLEDQKVVALYRIQRLLRAKDAERALAMLRASREVWPEGDVFGEEDAEPEDEFMTLREILFADMERPAGFVEEEGGDGGQEEVPAPATAPAPSASQGDGEAEADGEAAPEPAADPLDESGAEPEDGAEDELDEEDEMERDQVETQTVDQEFDLVQLIRRFAAKPVCMAYARLFKDYRNNSLFTNHCIVKMFHRIAYDCKLPALLFQVSIFRVFQKIHADRKVLKDASTLKEMHKFAHFLLGKFFETVERNKKVFMEACFWKTTVEANEIIEGYEATGRATARQKASFWSEEDEEKLGRLFEQFKEMREREEAGTSLEGAARPADEGDIVDQLENMFLDSGKTRRQIIRKLKEMELIQNVKELKPKKAKSGGRRQRKRRTGERRPDSSSEDEGDRPPRETDAQGNPIYKSKQWIETDDDSSSDDDNNDKNKEKEKEKETDADKENRPRSPSPAPTAERDSSRAASEVRSRRSSLSPDRRLASAPSSRLGTPSQNRSRRASRSPESSFLDSTLNDSRRTLTPSGARSQSPLTSSFRRSPSPNSTLNYSRRSAVRSPLSSPNTSRRRYSSSSSLSSRSRSRSRSRSSSPISSRGRTPLSSRLSTPMSSATKRPRPEEGDSPVKKTNASKKKRLNASSFLDSSDEEAGNEGSSPIGKKKKKKKQEAAASSDDAEEEEQQETPKSSPVKQRKKKRVMMLDSDSD